MSPIEHNRLTIAAMLATTLLGGRNYALQDTGIGNPGMAGHSAWHGNTLTLAGAGAGVDVGGADQMHVVHLAEQDGDFEVVARLVPSTQPRKTEGLERQHS